MYIYIHISCVYISYIYVWICIHTQTVGYVSGTDWKVWYLLSKSSTSLKTHPYVRYLTDSSCDWGSGSDNWLTYGKVTVFLSQIVWHSASRKYLSVTYDVCVSMSPLTWSLKNCFLSWTIDSSDDTFGRFLFGIESPFALTNWVSVSFLSGIQGSGVSKLLQ